MRQKIIAFVRRHKKLTITAIVAAVFVPVAVAAFCFLWINPYGKYVLNGNDVEAVKAKHIRVGVVMGSGVAPNGKPYKELQARLDVAAEALQKHEVQKLVLSGDNRFSHYDEPAAMQRYLVDVRHISKDKLQVDDAGRDTYATCERAAKIFGLKQTIIFSAGTHLPRAIFLCRHFGIEAYGIPSNLEANNARRREILARTKAVFNIYIYGEPTILGQQIKV